MWNEKTELQLQYAEAEPEAGAASSSRGSWILDHLRSKFYRNANVAFLTLLALASGGTEYPLVLILVGHSSSGKSYLLGWAVDLVRDAGSRILLTSQMTVAGMFSQRTLDAIVEDELIETDGFPHIRRQLISRKSVTRHLATPNGLPRVENLCGNIAFVSTALDDRPRDFQDSNRALVVRICTDQAQVAFHACRTVEAHRTRVHGPGDEWIVNLLTRLRQGAVRRVRVIPHEIANVLHDVPSRSPQLPRRVDQVLGVAANLARLRVVATGSNDSPSCVSPIHGIPEDIHLALELLVDVGVADDGPRVSDDDREFLTLLKGIFDGMPGSGRLSLSVLLRLLNEGAAARAAADFVHTNKRRGPMANTEPHWTRTVIERRVKRLADLGFVSMVPNPKRVSVTPQGRCCHAGANNIFAMMRDRVAMDGVNEPT